MSNDPWKNLTPAPLVSVPGEWQGASFVVDPGLYDKMPAGQFPFVVRVTEGGRSHDFFGGVAYVVR